MCVCVCLLVSARLYVYILNISLIISIYLSLFALLPIGKKFCFVAPFARRFVDFEQRLYVYVCVCV